MSLIYKNKLGETKKIAGYLTQRVNARWFLCTRVLEDGQEYYDVPEDQTRDYFANISPYTVYSFGFDESNTTNTPKLRFKGEVYDIEDLTAIEPHQLGLGQLKGVYQMFTQESEGDKTIYFIGDMHQDYDNIEGIVGRTIQLGLDGVIEANKVVFTVNHPETYLLYRTNGREFFMNAHLPVVLSTIEALDRTMQVAIKFGDTVYNLYDYMLGDGVPLTIGHLMSTVSYSQEVGFFFNFKAIFIENSDIVGFGIIPPAIIAPQLDNIIQDTDTVVTDMTTDGTKISIHLSADIVNKLAKVLVVPVSAPPSTELVGIGTDNIQKFIELGNDFVVENGTLKLNSGIGGYVEQVVKLEDKNTVTTVYNNGDNIILSAIKSIPNDSFKQSITTQTPTSIQIVKVEGNSSDDQIQTGIFIGSNEENNDTDTIHFISSKLLWNGKSLVPIDETYSISEAQWQALNDNEPYKYMTSVTATYTIGAETEVGILNNSPALFAIHGFVVGVVDNQTVRIFSIDKPTTDVSLTVRYRG